MKKWQVVVERMGTQGERLQKDVSTGFSLEEAIAHRNNMSMVYAADGWTPKVTGVQFQNTAKDSTVYLYVEAESF